MRGHEPDPRTRYVIAWLWAIVALSMLAMSLPAIYADTPTTTHHEESTP